MTKTPLVSVLMQTYNHEAYLAQALESVLMQQTNFDYEIVIVEDCSTDSTAAVLKEYCERYPEVMRPIFHESNLGACASEAEARFACKGEYVAVLEGDDYWTDPLKLQMQVDFLKAHPEYSATTHRIAVVDENGQDRSGYYYSLFCQDRIYTKKHAQKGLLPGHTASILYRNVFADMTDKEREAYAHCTATGDSKSPLVMLMYGDIFCSKRVMSAYRWVTSGGSSWSVGTWGENQSYENVIKDIEKIEMLKALNYDEPDFTPHWNMLAFEAFKWVLRRKKPEDKRILKEIYKAHPKKAAMVLSVAASLAGYPLRVIKRRFAKPYDAYKGDIEYDG